MPSCTPLGCIIYTNSVGVNSTSSIVQVSYDLREQTKQEQDTPLFFCSSNRFNNPSDLGILRTTHGDDI